MKKINGIFMFSLLDLFPSLAVKHTKKKGAPTPKSKRHEGGCLAVRKGIPGVPRGHGDKQHIGVNGIRGKSGGGR